MKSPVQPAKLIHFAYLLVLLITSNAFAAAKPETLTLQTHGRDVQIWHWTPAAKAKGIILYSHGAASAPLQYVRIIEPWVDAGYEVYAPLHVDSVEHPRTSEFQGLASWSARLQDMQMLADEFGSEGYIAAGHSYGALTALVKGGATGLLPEGTDNPDDPRVSVVLAFSPPAAIPGFIEKAGYATLSKPALIQTGTKDILSENMSWETHLDAWHAAPASGDHYALVLDDVDHYFGGAICRSDLPGPMQLEQLQLAVDTSLNMLTAYNSSNKPADAALNKSLGEHPLMQLSRK